MIWNVIIFKMYRIMGPFVIHWLIDINNSWDLDDRKNLEHDSTTMETHEKVSTSSKKKIKTFLWWNWNDKIWPQFMRNGKQVDMTNVHSRS